MNISKMGANKDALGEKKTTATSKLKLVLVRARSLTSFFSEAMIDRAKCFLQRKFKFDGKQLG